MRKSLSKPDSNSAGESSQAAAKSAGHYESPPRSSGSSCSASHPSFRMPSLVQTGKRRKKLSTFKFPDNDVEWSNDMVSITLPQGQHSASQGNYVLCSQGKDIEDEILYLVFCLKITASEDYRPNLFISLVDAAYTRNGTDIHSFVRDEKKPTGTSTRLLFEKYNFKVLRDLPLTKAGVDSLKKGKFLSEIGKLFSTHCEKCDWLDLLPGDLGDLRALFAKIKVEIRPFFEKLPRHKYKVPTRSAGAGSASAGSPSLASTFGCSASSSSAHALSLVQARGGQKSSKTLTFSDSGATWSNGKTSITLPQGQCSIYQEGYVLHSGASKDTTGEKVYLTFSIRIKPSSPVRGQYRPRLLIFLVYAVYFLEGEIYSFMEEGSPELPSISRTLTPEKYNFKVLRGLPLTKAGVDSLKEGQFLPEIGELFSTYCEKCDWVDAVPDDLGDLWALFAGMKAKLELFFKKLQAIAKAPASSAGVSARLDTPDNSQDEAAGLGGQKRSRAEGSDSDVDNPSPRKTRRGVGYNPGGYEPGLFYHRVASASASAALASLKLGEGHIKNRLA